MKTIHLKISRRDTPHSAKYWQEFRVPFRPSMNVISALMAIQRNPVDISGKTVKPVVWESNCLEEVCGACTMVINGKVRQACSALVEHLDQPITVEPMSKFPGVRDLIVDRSSMFRTLKKIKAWVPIDGTHNLGAGPKITPAAQQVAYKFSTCMTCGCCMESCPQFNTHSPFIGPFTFGQVQLFNEHPTGAVLKNDRLDSLMELGGIAHCGNAQNCVEACPKDIPITDAIAELGWDTTKRAFQKIFTE